MKQTRTALVARLKGFPRESYDSTNGWGFGGSRGYLYHVGEGRTVLIGSAYYRHLPSSPVTVFTGPDGRELDQDGVLAAHRWLDSLGGS